LISLTILISKPFRSVFRAVLAVLVVGWSAGVVRAQPGPSLSAAEESALRAAPAPATDLDSTVFSGEGKLLIQFSQAYFHQWAAGGQNNLSVITKLDRTWGLDRGRFGWDSEVHLAYGLQSRPDERILLKTDDRVELASKVGVRILPHGFATFMGSFRSQFAPGYQLLNGAPNRDVVLSRWMAPGYGVFAAGIDYKQPSGNLSLFVAPLTYKATWVHDTTLSAAGAFGVEPGLRARNEIGGYLKWAWTTPVVENVTYAVRMDLFSNFLKDPQNVDVFMDHLLTLKVNSILTTTVSATLLYDHDVQLQKSDPVLNPDGSVLTPARTGPGVQFREVLSVGLSLKL
jgi:hypothetical protein